MITCYRKTDIYKSASYMENLNKEEYLKLHSKMPSKTKKKYKITPLLAKNLVKCPPEKIFPWNFTETELRVRLHLRKWKSFSCLLGPCWLQSWKKKENWCFLHLSKACCTGAENMHSSHGRQGWITKLLRDVKLSSFTRQDFWTVHFTTRKTR